MAKRRKDHTPSINRVNQSVNACLTGSESEIRSRENARVLFVVAVGWYGRVARYAVVNCCVYVTVSKSLILSSSISALSGMISDFIVIVNLPVFIYVTLNNSQRASALILILKYSSSFSIKFAKNSLLRISLKLPSFRYLMQSSSSTLYQVPAV